MLFIFHLDVDQAACDVKASSHYVPSLYQKILSGIQIHSWDPN